MTSAIAAGVLGVVAAMGGGASGGDGGPGLLIVAPAEIAPALLEYAAFKDARLRTQLVTLEDALEAGGRMGACGDDAERLKRYLYHAWEGGSPHGEGAEPGGPMTGGVGYVLLVGDADVMPVRYMVLDRNTAEAFNYAFYPSDLYYADLARADGTFDDWNGRRDGFHAAYFGEVRGEHNKSDPINFDGVDYRPEVALGRWPVSTPEEAAVVAAKSMAYELAVEEGRVPARAAMVMVGGWVDARARMDDWARSLAGWSVERLYDGEGEDPARAPREGAVVDEINSGAGLVVHAGHGSDDAWHASLGTRSIPGIAGAPVTPVMLSAGCSTARFATLPPYEAYEDGAGVEHAGTNEGEVFAAPPPAPSCYARGAHNMTGFGERVLRDPGGAVAYIGCNTGSQPCGLTLAEGFVRAIGAGDAPGGTPGPTRLGDCWRRAVSYYYDAEHLATIEPTESWYPASIFFQGMKFMLFGDPSLPMARA